MEDNDEIFPAPHVKHLLLEQKHTHAPTVDFNKV